MATCPECDAEIEVDEFDVDKGDQLSCPECGSNLEVVGMAPLELDLAPTAAFRDLSFGQQRLGLIARAAIKVPPLVVMDEPTSGLDPGNRSRALDLIASLGTQRKSTVLMVTHRDDERAWWQQSIGGAILSLR